MRRYTLAFVITLLFSCGLFAQNSSGIKVTDIAVCTSVQNRQPVGIDSVFNSDAGKLYCFTEIKSQTDSTQISHVWFYNNKEMAKINLPVKAKSWHTWSAKTIIPAWKGNWRVEIQDKDGNVIATKSFRIN